MSFIDTADSAAHATMLTRLAAAKRLVLKIGTNVLVRPDGAVALGTLYQFIESVALLHRSGRQILIVSSGAVGLGIERLESDGPTATGAVTRARAAIGQSRLIAMYEAGFTRIGVTAAQLLVTNHDIADPRRCHDLQETIEMLLCAGAVPILNENDAVPFSSHRPSAMPARDDNAAPPSHEHGRLNFRNDDTCLHDNDMLSALMAIRIGAEALILLSDVDGLYNENPMRNAEARLIPLVRAMTPEIIAGADGHTHRGRGGMTGKLAAARLTMEAGIPTVLVNGHRANLPDLLSNMGRDDDRNVAATFFVPGNPASASIT